ncbi:hypothetical protein ACFLT2_01105 [Acidobacteriota bacterium]
MPNFVSLFYEMKSIYRLNLHIGLGAMLLAIILLVLDVRFMKTWFYICAWWPLLIILDSLNFRIGGSSPLSDSPRNFVFAAFISIPVWLVFELFNLRLQNWSYHNLPPELPLRWLGYCLAFASVIPILLELSALFKAALTGKTISFFPIKTTSGFLNGCILLGFLFLVLSILFPNLFFPLVWLGFIFLLEPLNYRLKIDSLLADAERQYGNRIVSWLLAGLASGVLWESLNYWAGSHWEYTLPYLNFGRIFQMPVFGFGGFLPFAIEVFAMYALLDFLRKKMTGKVALKAILAVLILAFNALAFYLMDTYTLIQ